VRRSRLRRLEQAGQRTPVSEARPHGEFRGRSESRRVSILVPDGWRRQDGDERRYSMEILLIIIILILLFGGGFTFYRR
jgi:hypothetical protein